MAIDGKDARPQVARHRRRSAMLAGLLSTFSVGLGHLYAGCARRGLIFLGALYAIVALGAVLRLWPTFRGFTGLMIALLVLYLAAIADAAWSARRHRDAPPARYQRWFVYLTATIPLLLLPNLVFSYSGKLLGFETQPVPGDAMSPTLERGEQVLISTWAYRRASPRPNDVIATRQPVNSLVALHRVVAVGGDTVQIDEGRLYVNDKPQEESSLPERPPALGPTAQLTRTAVPAGQLFVLGETGARDGRGFWGLVRGESVIGRVTEILVSPERERIGTKIH